MSACKYLCYLVNNLLWRPDLDKFYFRGMRRYKIYRNCLVCRQQRFTDDEINILSDKNLTKQKFNDCFNGCVDIVNPYICNDVWCSNMFFSDKSCRRNIMHWLDYKCNLNILNYNLADTFTEIKKIPVTNIDVKISKINIHNSPNYELSIECRNCFCERFTDADINVLASEKSSLQDIIKVLSSNNIDLRNCSKELCNKCIGIVAAESYDLLVLFPYDLIDDIDTSKNINLLDSAIEYYKNCRDRKDSRYKYYNTVYVMLTDYKQSHNW